MNKLIKIVESGKFFAVGGLAVIAFVVIAALISEGVPSIALGLVASLLLLALVIVQLRASKIRASKTKNAIQQLQMTISNLRSEVTQVGSTQGELERVAKSVGALEKKIEDIPGTLLDVPGLATCLTRFDLGYGNSFRSGFFPLRLKSGTVISKNQQQKGRLAADFLVEGNLARNLAIALDTGSTDSVRRVTGICDEPLRQRLQTIACYTPLLPGRELNMVDHEISYVVIDETATSTGAWASVIDTSRTKLFFSLVEVLKSAREAGAVIILIQSAIPHHFSDSLRKLSTVVLNESGDLSSGSQAKTLPVCQVIIEHQKEIHV